MSVSVRDWLKLNKWERLMKLIDVWEEQKARTAMRTK